MIDSILSFDIMLLCLDKLKLCPLALLTPITPPPGQLDNSWPPT